jgi:hypothetical protein
LATSQPVFPVSPTFHNVGNVTGRFGTESNQTIGISGSFPAAGELPPGFSCQRLSHGEWHAARRVSVLCVHSQILKRAMICAAVCRIPENSFRVPLCFDRASAMLTRIPEDNSDARPMGSIGTRY